MFRVHGQPLNRLPSSGVLCAWCCVVSNKDLGEGMLVRLRCSRRARCNRDKVCVNTKTGWQAATHTLEAVGLVVNSDRGNSA